jgi:DnaJ-class molecular chaperone
MVKKGLLRTCSVCGKLLEVHPCRACAGTGKARDGLFGKRACERCHGTGRLLLCPDRAMHLAGALPKVGGVGVGPAGGGLGTPARRTCPTCKGTKGIRHPFTGQAGPCPRCGGKGWV